MFNGMDFNQNYASNNFLYKLLNFIIDIIDIIIM